MSLGRGKLRRYIIFKENDVAKTGIRGPAKNGLGENPVVLTPELNDRYYEAHDLGGIRFYGCVKTPTKIGNIELRFGPNSSRIPRVVTEDRWYFELPRRNHTERRAYTVEIFNPQEAAPFAVVTIGSEVFVCTTRSNGLPIVFQYEPRPTVRFDCGSGRTLISDGNGNFVSVSKTNGAWHITALRPKP